jgi:hypothetical protein
MHKIDEKYYPTIKIMETAEKELIKIINEIGKAKLGDELVQENIEWMIYSLHETNHFIKSTVFLDEHEGDIRIDKKTGEYYVNFYKGGRSHSLGNQSELELYWNAEIGWLNGTIFIENINGNEQYFFYSRTRNIKIQLEEAMGARIRYGSVDTSTSL